MNYYPDAPGLGWHVWLGVTITIVPATLLVGLRFYTRITRKIGVQADDWLIVAALFFAWSMAIIRYIELVRYGLGYHKADLPENIVVTYQKVCSRGAYERSDPSLMVSDIPRSPGSLLRLCHPDAIVTAAAVQADLWHLEKVHSYHLCSAWPDPCLVHLVFPHSHLRRMCTIDERLLGSTPINVYLSVILCGTSGISLLKEGRVSTKCFSSRSMG